MKKRAKKVVGPMPTPMSSLHVLVSAEEHAEAQADADARGVSLSEHVRTVLGIWRRLPAPPAPPPVPPVVTEPPGPVVPGP